MIKEAGVVTVVFLFSVNLTLYLLFIYFITFAVNLACAMKYNEPNKEFGLLDADIFGPSIPLMMNLHEEPFVTKGIL